MIKLIPYERPLVRFDEQIVQIFATTPFPDGSMVYRQCWKDPEGYVVKMDYHSMTLRSYIGPDIQLSEYDWLQIMLGIAERLVSTHEMRIAHGDLKPSNGKKCGRLYLTNL